MVGDFLSYDVEYVHTGLATETANPPDFYRGAHKGWAAVEQGLDVRRKLVDQLLYDVVLPGEDEKASAVELYVVKAEAGAGKTVCLQRVAWLAATEASKICLFKRLEGRLRYEAVAEISQHAKERLFLFVDDAADNVNELAELIGRAKADRLRLTVITAERQNEWNIACERLEDSVTANYPLPYLSGKEIEDLIDLLEQHKSLGDLAGVSRDERVQAFVRRAGRQLLVALLEATRGVSFEDILVDEFNHITPPAAQALYLTVCVLNRLGIPVRAGLISRIHGIPFEEFRERLFRPLEHVVIVGEDPRLRDHLYMARHRLIAERVFDRILSTPTSRFNEYVRVVEALNLAYSTDLSAFRQLVRAGALLDLFPDHGAVLEIYRVAFENAGDDPFLLHQRGIYEIQRPNGNLTDAEKFLAAAKAVAPHDVTIIHSFAELERRRAEIAPNPLVRQRHRAEARKLALEVRDDSVHGSYGYHTLLKLMLDQLKEVLIDPKSGDAEIDRLLQDIEQTLENGLQRFPEDSYLLSAEADLSELLVDEDRARHALRAAFDRNRRSPFIAARLSRVLSEAGDAPGAKAVLETALDTNAGGRRLHFSYALLLRESKQDPVDTMLHHLRRSFSPGDKNYYAQFWYAAYLFMKDDVQSLQESRALFRTLWAAPLGHELRSKVRGTFDDAAGHPRVFTGTLSRKDVAFGWLSRDGHGDRIYVREEQLPEDSWDLLYERQTVQFQIGFNFAGALALEVKPRV